MFQFLLGSSMWFIMISGISQEVLGAFRTALDVIVLLKWPPQLRDRLQYIVQGSLQENTTKNEGSGGKIQFFQNWTTFCVQCVCKQLQKHPKCFQISFLGHRNGKFIILKSKVKKHFLVKNQARRLPFTTMLMQKFLRNFAKTALERRVEPFRKCSGSRSVFI